MKERMEARLRELELEYQKGQQQLQELEGRANDLRNTLMRISGAIQVLREELGYADQQQHDEQGN